MDGESIIGYSKYLSIKSIQAKMLLAPVSTESKDFEIFGVWRVP